MGTNICFIPYREHKKNTSFSEMFFGLFSNLRYLNKEKQWVHKQMK